MWRVVGRPHARVRCRCWDTTWPIIGESNPSLSSSGLACEPLRLCEMWTGGDGGKSHILFLVERMTKGVQCGGLVGDINNLELVGK